MMDKPEITELEVEGMTCSTCALSVEKYLKKTGAEDVSVNFATKEVRFRNTANTPLPELESGIENLGYKVITEKKTGEKPSRLTRLEKLLILSAVFTLPLLLHMVVPMHHALNNPWLQLTLSLPPLTVGLLYFGKSAFSAVRRGTSNMDVLIFIGFISAFGYSLAGVLMHSGTHEVHNYLFFETSATIITLVLLGNWIEERSVAKTTQSLGELVGMSKSKARLLKTDEHGHQSSTSVEADMLLPGDLVQVNTGDQIVADGIVEKGDGEVDESLITGESTPVFREKGSPLISGSLLLSGSLVYKVRKAGKNSTLSRIIQLVKDAQSKKPRIQKFGDQVSSVFVPVVVSISLITFLLSYFAFDIQAPDALMAAIAVLVISCPCAMGLATPTAVMVGVGKGAQNGVLIKGGETVEKLARIKTVVFDKTGTLTNGEFRVKDFITYDFDETVAKNIVLHMEKKSSHPLAQSIVKNYPDWFMMPFDYEKFEEIKGKGLLAVDQGGNQFRLGNRQWVAEENSDAPDKDILLSYCGRVIAGFDVEDRVKDGTREAIMAIQKMGIRPVLLSGDNEKKCRYVAERTGITEFYHSQLPEMKLELIRKESARAPVAMVGDGINDAPALSLADIGISLGSATDIAKESAEVIILSGQISKVGLALKLGRATYTTIRQNLFWALAYNVVAIPVAAMGMLSPMVAAFSMAFSDVVVVGNSLRLKVSKRIR